MAKEPWSVVTILTAAPAKGGEVDSRKKEGPPAATTKKRGKGRPASCSLEVELLIAGAVYKAVFSGEPYRDAALERGQEVARQHGCPLSKDGVEAVIERLCGKLHLPEEFDPFVQKTRSPSFDLDAELKKLRPVPESLYALPPGMAYRSFVQVVGQFLPEHKLPNGKKTLAYKPDTLGKINHDLPRDDIPTLKIRCRPPEK